MDARSAQFPGYSSDRLLRMILGIEDSQLVHVVAKLGIADLLADGPRSALDLAEATESHPEFLARVLRLLVKRRLFDEVADGVFALGLEGAALQRGVPGSLWSFAVLTGEEWYWRMHGELLQVVKTGQSQFEKLYGMGTYDYLVENPGHGRVFSEFMEDTSAAMSHRILQAYDFSEFQRVVDIGGGRASLLIALLERHPSMRGVLFDRPPVLEGARPRFEERGVLQRCELVAGDFFQSVPAGGDLYVLRNVLHDWNDQQVQTILDNCRRAMDPQRRLLISEALLEEWPRTDTSWTCEIQSMVASGGRLRTAAQFEALLESSGFELLQVLPTKPALSLLEARPREAAGASGGD